MNFLPNIFSQTATNPLDALADVSLGNEITWWPLAWGWWLVIALTWVLIITGIVIALRAYRQRRVKRLALRALNMLNEHAQDSMQQAHAILRRACLGYFASADVASLHGQAWVDFLMQEYDKRRASHQQREDLEHNLKLMQDDLYRAQPELTGGIAIETIEHWINRCLPPRKNKESSDV